MTDDRGAAPALDPTGFRRLMTRLAAAWESLDVEDAVECFAVDATYLEPPDIQWFHNHEELRVYFGALTRGTFMRFHNLWFDEETQIGAAEYSFGVKGSSHADHGVVVVEVREGRIASWREYQRKGPWQFRDFISPNGKDWQWHIGNYP